MKALYSADRTVPSSNLQDNHHIVLLGSSWAPYHEVQEKCLKDLLTGIMILSRETKDLIKPGMQCLEQWSGGQRLWPKQYYKQWVAGHQSQGHLQCHAKLWLLHLHQLLGKSDMVGCERLPPSPCHLTHAPSWALMSLLIIIIIIIIDPLHQLVTQIVLFLPHEMLSQFSRSSKHPNLKLS